MDLDSLWSRKRATIAQTRGLTVDPARQTFSDIGGLSQLKRFGEGLFRGGAPPRAIVRLEEIEKAMAGAGGSAGLGDTSGVSQDALSVILNEMEDQGYSGLILVGPPGTGKSLYCQALGATFGVLSMGMDLGGMKSSYVGSSEVAIRSAMRTVRAVAGPGGAFFVASCNALETLKPELRRRFRMGIWYLDLPDQEEKGTIWPICLKKYGLGAQKRPDDRIYTGADIRNVCDIAWRLGCSLQEAAQFIVPVAKSDPEAIDRLRRLAHGRFLSASAPGVYQMAPRGQEPSRQISVEA